MGYFSFDRMITTTFVRRCTLLVSSRSLPQVSDLQCGQE